MPPRKVYLAWLFSGVMFFIALILGYLAVVGLKGSVVVIEWSTASELDTAGFNLYRGQSPNGPFVKINTDLIPASPDPLVGGSYNYKDHQAEAGVVYYYQLEDVEYNGNRSRFGPIEVKATSAGKAEGILAAAFALVGVLGFILLKR
jgi:hypothetical protein